MTYIHFSEPPPPPDGEQWCLFCLMLAKKRILDRHEHEIGVLAGDGKTAVKWFAWEARPEGPLRTACCEGFTDMPQLGRVPVCWDHLVGVKMARIPAAGLIRGQG